jgi:hypothetical protein
LDLETTELSDEGTGRFIDAICGKPSSLQNLYLNANGIGQRACASLSKYIASPECVLQSLFLSTNPIGDAGVVSSACLAFLTPSQRYCTVAKLLLIVVTLGSPCPRNCDE